MKPFFILCTAQLISFCFTTPIIQTVTYFDESTMDVNSFSEHLTPSCEKLQASVKIVGAYCFPHGAITLDPETRNFSGVPAVKPDSKEKSILLHNAMKAQAETLASQNPDLIILSTPHGLKLQNEYLIIGNRLAKGSAEWEGDWLNYTAQFEVETNLSQILYNSLYETKINASLELLNLGDADADPLPLRWAEVIPWFFISDAYKTARNRTPPPVIMVGQPVKRNNGHLKDEQIPELLELGETIGHVLETNIEFQNKKIAIVISSDLSHYHSNDSTSLYPYNPNSTVFDEAIKKWANNDISNSTLNISNNFLIEEAGSLADTIGTCGYTGLVMLQGILSHFSKSTEITYKSTFLEYAPATYYGMMVNHFILVE